MTKAGPWLLLLHQIPPQPAYFRAKVLRRLTRAGALPVKNSAYLLPDCEEAREDFEWICQEINQQGGAAWLFRATVIEGWSEDEIQQSFRGLIEPEYESLIADARQLLPGGAAIDDVGTQLPRIMRRAGELRRIDYGESPLRPKLEGLMQAIEKKLEKNSVRKVARAKSPAGQIWITRKGIKVDRIGSAWLIRRFIDPRAAFRFVDPERYKHRAGETRFDMVGAEFGHEGEACTFEVLQASHGLGADKALTALAQMVHDIDLKDDRYQRPATAGLSRMIDGLTMQTASDETRLDRGFVIFESMYQSFR